MICLLLPVCRRWSGGVAASRPEAFWRNFSKALLGARWRPQVGGFSQAGKPRLREARKKHSFIIRRRLQFQPHGAARKEE